MRRRTTEVLRAKLASAAASLGTVVRALVQHAFRVRRGHDHKGGEEQGNTQWSTERHG